MVDTGEINHMVVCDHLTVGSAFSTISKKPCGSGFGQKLLEKHNPITVPFLNIQSTPADIQAAFTETATGISEGYYGQCSQTKVNYFKLYLSKKKA